jgi:hypothetical protein
MFNVLQLIYAVPSSLQTTFYRGVFVRTTAGAAAALNPGRVSAAAPPRCGPRGTTER